MMKKLAALLFALPLTATFVHAAPSDAGDHPPGIAAQTANQAAPSAGGCAHCAGRDCADCPFHVAMQGNVAMPDGDHCAD
ncbi:hypothetical protein [Methylocystis heyeri]|uniref:Uncharacterized protein n=1 Tax=Methylocystis heyeri TaxID=391905 RepID=A0A6B8KE16_9HYPH|nr:hypothetical protein [Methylocystis heyeri]QGM45939.1 hypothetical protein H2LOC_009615 [Methylocystis heyeri]